MDWQGRVINNQQVNRGSMYINYQRALFYLAAGKSLLKASIRRMGCVGHSINKTVTSRRRN